MDYPYYETSKAYDLRMQRAVKPDADPCEVPFGSPEQQNLRVGGKDYGYIGTYGESFLNNGAPTFGVWTF